MAKSKFPQHVKDKVVKRFFAGEQATALAKEYKVSKPGLYQWAAKAKKDLLEQSKQANMTPEDIEKSSKKVMAIELEQLRLENRKLRDRILAMMIKSGEI